MDNVKLSVVILAKNEEENIERCLRSVRFADEVIVVDDYSTDKTLEIAKKYADTVVQRRLNDDFTQQRNFALSLAKGEWILYIDADEEVSVDLENEIKGSIANNLFKKKAYYIRRRDYWWGKEIRFGETLSARNKGFIRLIQKNSGKWMGKVHEQFILNSFVGTLHHHILHFPHKTLKNFISEVNHYSTIRAGELYKSGKQPNIYETIIFPIGKFIYSYFIQLGFLDGAPGFVYSFLMSFHSFLVRAKLYQYTKFPSKT